MVKREGKWGVDRTAGGTTEARCDPDLLGNLRPLEDIPSLHLSVCPMGFQ